MIVITDAPLHCCCCCCCCGCCGCGDSSLALAGPHCLAAWLLLLRWRVINQLGGTTETTTTTAATATNNQQQQLLHHQQQRLQPGWMGKNWFEWIVYIDTECCGPWSGHKNSFLSCSTAVASPHCSRPGPNKVTLGYNKYLG